MCRRFLGTTSSRPLVVLGLESSADDSCASIVTSDRRILSNAVVKQHTLNAQYGGIHPMKAIEAHQAGMVSSPIAYVVSSKLTAAFGD